jgi:hypothetical protein
MVISTLLATARDSRGTGRRVASMGLASGSLKVQLGNLFAGQDHRRAKFGVGTVEARSWPCPIRVSGRHDLSHEDLARSGKGGVNETYR